MVFHLASTVYSDLYILIRRLSDKKKLTPNVIVDDSPGIGDYRFESDKSECRTSENAEHFSSTPRNYYIGQALFQSNQGSTHRVRVATGTVRTVKISKSRAAPYQGGGQRKNLTKRCVDPCV